MKNSYSASVREELIRRTFAELGIEEKGKERLKPCCGDAFLCGAFLCAGEVRGEEIALARGRRDLSVLCAHILARFYGEGAGFLPDGAVHPLCLSARFAAAFLSGGGVCEDCRKLFLRAAFLACGTVTDPAKGYRAVFRCASEEAEREIRDALNVFSLEPGASRTKKGRLVYVKKGEKLCDLLVVLGAPRHSMRLQEYMVETSFRSEQQRKVNSELANVQKVVNGAQGVIADIRFLTERGVLDAMPLPLREAARLRLENPDLSLKELCRLFPGSISKSGLNHRLQKLSARAGEIREEEKKK